MRIIEKLAARARDNQGAPGVTIAFLGDSVTQGCFEVYVKNDGDIEAVYDPRHAYHRQVQDILAVLYPSVPVNIINAGGYSCGIGEWRPERDGQSGMFHVSA